MYEIKGFRLTDRKWREPAEMRRKWINQQRDMVQAAERRSKCDDGDGVDCDAKEEEEEDAAVPIISNASFLTACLFFCLSRANRSIFTAKQTLYAP